MYVHLDLSNKYKTLFRNKAIRHMFNRIDIPKINNQIRRLEDMDLVNFFVLGKIENINRVLQAAAEESYFGKKYSWTAITKVQL